MFVLIYLLIALIVGPYLSFWIIYQAYGVVVEPTGHNILMYYLYNFGVAIIFQIMKYVFVVLDEVISNR